MRRKFIAGFGASEADILPADQYDGVNDLTLVGYPASRSKEKRQTRKVRTKCYSIGVRVLSVEGAVLRGSFHLTRHRDGKSGLKVTAPDPHGMSGGAMFASKVRAANCDGNRDTKLAGISTTWLEERHSPGWRNEVVGTKTAIPLAIIRDYVVSTSDALAPARVTTFVLDLFGNFQGSRQISSGHSPAGGLETV